MGRLLKREWTYDKNSVWKGLLPGLILSVLVLVLYKIDKSILLAMMRGIFRFPKAIYQLFGLREGMSTGSFGFYLLFFAIFINFWLVWDSCRRMIGGVYRDVRGDRLHSLMNQLYSKEQLAIGKYSGILLVSVLQVTIWHLLLVLFAVLGNILPQQRSQTVLTILHLYLISLAIHIFFSSLSFFLAVWKGKRGKGFYPAGILFGTLLVGNVWKIRELLLLLFQKLSVSKSKLLKFEHMFAWLDELYWVSPLSWMNPLQLKSGGIFVLQILLLLVGSAFFTTLGVRLYGPEK